MQGICLGTTWKSTGRRLPGTGGDSDALFSNLNKQLKSPNPAECSECSCPPLKAHCSGSTSSCFKCSVLGIIFLSGSYSFSGGDYVICPIFFSLLTASHKGMVPSCGCFYEQDPKPTTCFFNLNQICQQFANRKMSHCKG